MSTMRPEVKRRWVEALRSGRYRQGFGTLHDTGDDSYCPLGVLVEVAIAAGVNVVREDLDGTLGRVSRYDGCVYILPPSVRAWAVLDRPDPLVLPPEGGELISISGLNDDLGLPFAEIATVIDQQL